MTIRARAASLTEPLLVLLAILAVGVLCSYYARDAADTRRRAAQADIERHVTPVVLTEPVLSLHETHGWGDGGRVLTGLVAETRGYFVGFCIPSPSADAVDPALAEKIRGLRTTRQIRGYVLREFPQAEADALALKMWTEDFAPAFRNHLLVYHGKPFVFLPHQGN